MPSLDHREIKSAPATPKEALNHVVEVESELKFVTRHAGLGDPKKGRADPESIPNA
jgi:hypothetical protein